MEVFRVIERPVRTIKPPRSRLYLKNGLLFPHPMDRHIAKMPYNQRFEVNQHGLGPWQKGDVIERHIDLVGAHLPTLLGLRAIVPTQKPAHKAPATIANLKQRAAVLGRMQDHARAVAQQVRAPVTNEAVLQAPIPGVITGKVTG
jgi:hypothetical protein